MNRNEALALTEKARTEKMRANLWKADLSKADLSGADLSGAYLSGADLWGADLSGADLSWANLSRADYCGTCLDPKAEPNSDIEGFEVVGTCVTGYRTRKAGHIDEYRDGRYYSADWFSVSDTECHPGLYLWPTLEAAKRFSGSVEYIRVETKSSEIHRAGTKWRCRWFHVLGAVI